MLGKFHHPVHLERSNKLNNRIMFLLKDCRFDIIGKQYNLHTIGRELCSRIKSLIKKNKEKLSILIL